MPPIALRSDLLNDFADPAGRTAAAVRCAVDWGVEAVLVLIRDRDLGTLRPAPGFIQTLPGGPTWRALLGRSVEGPRWTGTVAFPVRDRMVPFAAFNDNNAVLLILGGAAERTVLDLAAIGFPLLARLLQAEDDVVIASGIAKTAAKALDQAESLTASLDTARTKLAQALSDSDRLNSALNTLNATLEERVGERTQELEAEMAERQKTEALLQQSQKMEAVGQLTGGLAHDFNNLLAGISGALELMQIRMGQGRISDLDRYMTVAQGAAKRAAALTHRLLAFSRRQTLDPKPTNVNQLIGGMEELVRRTIGPQVALEVVGAAGLWVALIDPGQLENALLNLCINARDAMPDGGRITIETANKWLDRPAAVARAIPEGQYLSVCVTDTGTGMPPEVIARVFEPFFTTKPIGEGTGLGLSMIHGFAQQSGGQVRIYSEVDQGTTVCLYLPRHYGEARDDDIGLQVADVGRAGQDETVLIVDDEPSVRMLVTEVLEDLGYTAIEAADSVAGLRVLQSDVRIDLLVTDVGLPGGMNGRQMADAGRERRPDLKVLFITGYAENSLIGNGHLEPGMQVLTKPFAMEALTSRIKDFIAQ